jgi:hypothetical protein
MSEATLPADYSALLGEIKERIRVPNTRPCGRSTKNSCV